MGKYKSRCEAIEAEAWAEEYKNPTGLTKPRGVKYLEMARQADEEFEQLQAENEALRRLLSRADDELEEMTMLDCPAFVERDEGLEDEIRLVLDPEGGE